MAKGVILLCMCTTFVLMYNGLAEAKSKVPNNYNVQHVDDSNVDTQHSSETSETSFDTVSHEVEDSNVEASDSTSNEMNRYNSRAKPQLKRHKRSYTCPGGRDYRGLPNADEAKLLIEGKKPIRLSVTDLRRGIKMSITKKDVNKKDCLELKFKKQLQIDVIVLFKKKNAAVNTIMVKYLDGSKWKFIEKNGKPDVLEIVKTTVQLKIPKGKTTGIRIYPQTWPGKNPFLQFVKVRKCPKSKGG